MTLSVDQANAVWDILVEHAGASDNPDVGERESFVHLQTTRHLTEYRFIGNLGSGGKFWRNTSKRPDGSWGEMWYINCYRESETPERLAAIQAANEALEALRSASDRP